MRKILILILFFIATNIFAISLQTSTSVPVLYVQVYHNNKWSEWSNKATVVKGDKLWFHIHAYANGGDVQNLVSSIDNLSGRSFKKGELVTVNAFVNADNATKLRGSVQVYFADDIKLEYSNYYWATKLKGPNPEANEHPKKVSYGQSGREVLTNLGVRLGNLAQDHRSNFLLSYNTAGVQPSINGACGENKNSCRSGKFIDLKDISGLYKWKCLGLNGGQSDYCELKKDPIDAICSTYWNKCKIGWFSDLKDDQEYYIWKCNGYNGGQSQICQKKKTPINAICGKKTNSCIKGKFKDIKDSYEKKYWECLGYHGGENVSCSIQKYCPCKKEVVIENNQPQGPIIPQTTSTQNSIGDDNCDRWKVENRELSTEVENLRNKINTIGTDYQPVIGKKRDCVSWKAWYWILFFMYSIIIFLIGMLIGKKMNS